MNAVDPKLELLGQKLRPILETDNSLQHPERREDLRLALSERIDACLRSNGNWPPPTDREFDNPTLLNCDEAIRQYIEHCQTHHQRAAAAFGVNKLLSALLHDGQGVRNGTQSAIDRLAVLETRSAECTQLDRDACQAMIRMGLPACDCLKKKTV